MTEGSMENSFKKPLLGDTPKHLKVEINRKPLTRLTCHYDVEVSGVLFIRHCADARHRVGHQPLCLLRGWKHDQVIPEP